MNTLQIVLTVAAWCVFLILLIYGVLALIDKIPVKIPVVLADAIGLAIMILYGWFWLGVLAEFIPAG